MKYFTKKVGLPLLAAFIALVGLVLVSQTGTALAWNLQPNCIDQNTIGGSIDVPDGGTYNVFVEQRTGAYNWEWVQDAGVNVTGPGIRDFTIDVSKAKPEAVQLRALFKDMQGNYFYGDAKVLSPCRPAPLNLNVWDLQAECIDPQKGIYGGMIGIPADANGFPWVVFMEYAGPSGSPEDVHWVKPTGSHIGTDEAPALLGMNNQFEFQVPTWNPDTRDGIPPGVTELRVRFKSLAVDPHPYGDKISETFPPCPGTTPPTNPPTPCPCPPPTNPPVYEPIRVYPPPPPAQPIVINNSSGSGSTATSSGGGTSSGGNPCCSHGCCDGGDVSQTQDQTQSQTQTTGDVNVTVNGQDQNGDGDDDDGGTRFYFGGDGNDDFWDWWWLIPAALILLAIVGVAGFIRRNGNHERVERTERVTHEPPPPSDPQPTA